MSSSAPFTFVTAFSSTPFGGNPAAVAFIDPDTPFHILQGISKNFNQPMTAFVKPLDPSAISASGSPSALRTKIRYVTFSGIEVALCGHASIAAASAILALPALADVAEQVQLVEFETYSEKRVVPVRKVHGGMLELGLPVSSPVETTKEEQERFAELVKKAFGREIGVVKVLVGAKGFEHAVLVEVDEEARLAEAQVDVNVFANTGYTQNVITSRSSSPAASKGEYEYIYRMFSSHVPGGEDSVCGSAQCLLAPYWHEKKGLEVGKEIATKSVSPRGGVVNVLWDRVVNDNETVESIKLRGTTALLTSGVCYF